MKIVLILLAVVAVGIADVFLKQAARVGELVEVFKSPWFMGAILLYVFQVVVFAYLFVTKVQLSYVGILQTVLYAIIVLGSGYFLFHETFSAIQYVGMGLALLGVILINFPS